MTRTFAGIDVGAMTLGLALWEVDDEGNPIRLLNAQTVLHDGGVHRGMEKTATTRLAARGVARRTRRRYRRRRARLKHLDELLAGFGYPITPLAKLKNPRAPWEIRARLADSYVDNDAERLGAISIALRHIARHRGWRNPYLRVDTFRTAQEVSDGFKDLAQKIGVELPPEGAQLPTVAQMVARAMNGWADLASNGPKIRGVDGLMVARLNQSDYANELHRIFDVQKVDPKQAWELIAATFAAESPRGSWLERVGKDPLPGQRSKPRTSKADPAFQEFRVRGVVANLRIGTGDAQRVLTVSERQGVADLLLGWTSQDAPTWTNVAAALGVTRRQLTGTATAGLDGEPATRPPIKATDAAIQRCKVPALRKWWLTATEDERANLVEVIAGDREPNEDDAVGLAVYDLMTGLSPEELVHLEALNLPAGRAAYSRDTLRRLNARMATSQEDVHTARREEFKLSDDWRPPTEPISAPLGNPAVDRVTKAVGRWLLAVERTWGAPDRIVVEHVRDAFVSTAQARELERSNEARRAVRERTRKRMALEGIGDLETIRDAQVRRFIAVERQNCTCAYCGDTITYQNAQLDHVVPRAGRGSRSTEDNLLAVCEACNREKSNQPFGIWAAASNRKGVSVEEAKARVRHWIVPPGWGSPKELKDLKTRVGDRLARTEEDDSIDERAMESVAWMARELATRIRAHFTIAAEAEGASAPDVWVFRGAVTSEARHAAGIDKKFTMLGGVGKQRFDRRHHVMDAAVVALITPAVGQVLGERVALMREERLASRVMPTGWREHTGSTIALKVIYQRWQQQMQIAVEHLQESLDNDQIPVVNPLRLGANVGRLHDDTIFKMKVVQLGGEISAEAIDRASTPALWHALTRLEDYDPVKGLPATERRRIRVNGEHFDEDDLIELFGTGSAALAVRGGWAALGNSIHHARIYRFLLRGKPVYGMVRVFAVDLARQRGGDLFSTELDAGSISLRTAEGRTRTAVVSGAAEYLGWLVPGDELELALDPSTASSAKLKEFLVEYPGMRRWEMAGFEAQSQVNLRPLLMSKESIPGTLTPNARSIVERSWRPSVDVLMKTPGLRVIRRDALASERTVSAAHLPVSWSPEQ